MCTGATCDVYQQLFLHPKSVGVIKRLDTILGRSMLPHGLDTNMFRAPKSVMIMSHYRQRNYTFYLAHPLCVGTHLVAGQHHLQGPRNAEALTNNIPPHSYVTKCAANGSLVYYGSIGIFQYAFQTVKRYHHAVNSWCVMTLFGVFRRVTTRLVCIRGRYGLDIKFMTKTSIRFWINGIFPEWTHYFAACLFSPRTQKIVFGFFVYLLSIF